MVCYLISKRDIGVGTEVGRAQGNSRLRCNERVEKRKVLKRPFKLSITTAALEVNIIKEM